MGDLDAFSIHDRIVASIVQTHKEQVALEEAPRRIDPVQQQVVTLLEGYLTNPRYKRRQLLDLIKFVGAPKSGAQIKALKKTLPVLSSVETGQAALQDLARLKDTYGTSDDAADTGRTQPLDPSRLRLICFDHISGG
jgi:hypothetical protein